MTTPVPLPSDMYEYANLFSYATWVPASSVVLCNVPWDSSYRDVARFPTADDKRAYFDRVRANATSVQIDKLSIVKPNEPVHLNVPFSVASQHNYLIVDSPLMPVPNEAADAKTTYYYFVLAVEYVAPNTTRVLVQLDVWQTYYEDVAFTRCYVERGHIALANTNATNQNASDYLTIPEGLDVGNEYEIVHTEYYNLLSSQPWVIIVTTTDLLGDVSNYGTISNPTLKTATGGTYDNMPNGANIYALRAGNFEDLMEALSPYPWVAQGIVMLTVVPSVLIGGSTENATIAGIPALDLKGHLTPDYSAYTITDTYAKFDLPARYSALKKFLTFPYSFIEMSTLTGGEIILKPECMHITTGTNSTYFGKLSCLAPPHMRAYFYPTNYNAKRNSQNIPEDGALYTWKRLDDTSEDGEIPNGEFLDHAVQIGNFPQFPLVNNGYLSVLAQTAHTRQYQHQTAEWSQAKANAGISLSYDQASKGIGAGFEQTEAGIAAERDRFRGTQINAGSGVAVGAVAGMAVGPVGAGAGAAIGAAAGAAGAAIQNAVAARTIDINSALSRQQTGIAADVSRYARDTNYDYAKFAARGDYQNAIQAINARVQDARLTQPSTAGQNGGEAFNLSNGMVGVVFRFKRIKDQALATIGEYFYRYGYYVNRFITPPADLHCCQRFTYWKMQETYLNAGRIPETHKEAIRGMFEKGVTVWRNPDEIGVVDVADNTPLEGVSY